MSDATHVVRSATDEPLDAWLQSRVLRHANASPDFAVSKAWSALDPRYRRGLIRRIGEPAAAGATLAAGHFTMFMEVFPPGCEGGLHAHPDAEEVYVVLEGDGVVLAVECDGERSETSLERHDVAVIPPGVYRVIANRGSSDALVLVVFGSPRPQKASIAPSHPMAGVAR